MSDQYLIAVCLTVRQVVGDIFDGRVGNDIHDVGTPTSSAMLPCGMLRL